MIRLKNLAVGIANFNKGMEDVVKDPCQRKRRNASIELISIISMNKPVAKDVSETKAGSEFERQEGSNKRVIVCMKLNPKVAIKNVFVTRAVKRQTQTQT